MIKLHVTSKTVSETGEVTINITPITTDGTIINGSLTLITNKTNDNMVEGKDYDMNLNEIVG
jgi:hypothetical protein